MKIEEAILHARAFAEGCPGGDRDCAYQHDKLADWLEELKMYQAIGLTPEDVKRLKGYMQSTAIQNEPLTLEELQEMDGLPVWVELVDGRREYGLVCIEEFGTKIYVRMQYDTFLAYNHDVPNKLFWSKICRYSPVMAERAGKSEEKHTAVHIPNGV